MSLIYVLGASLYLYIHYESGAVYRTAYRRKKVFYNGKDSMSLVFPIVSIFQGLIGQAKLGRMSVDYSSIWKEVSSTGFKGELAVSEFDKTSLVRLQERIQVAVQLLRNDELDKVQRRRVKSKIKQMLSRLARVQVLAKRVDTSIPQFGEYYIYKF